MLTDKDPHWWGPNPLVQAWIVDKIAPEARVLDVGPGHAPFLRANEFVDIADPSSFKFPENEGEEIPHRAFYKVDLSAERLPFDNNVFDFVHCRHTLEDMWNPFLLLQEMQRVGKRGYIETPSPYAELARGQDTQILRYRGYHHHRWLTWIDGDTLTFVTKWPMVEYVASNDDKIEDVLRLGPYYWNSYLLWDDTIAWKHVQCPQDYDIAKDYPQIMADACSASRRSSDKFFRRIFDDAVNHEGAHA